MNKADLKLCEQDDKVCVTDLRDCAPRPPSSILSEYTRTHTNTVEADVWLFLSLVFGFGFYLVLPLRFVPEINKM